MSPIHNTEVSFDFFTIRKFAQSSFFGNEFLQLDLEVKFEDEASEMIFCEWLLGSKCLNNEYNSFLKLVRPQQWCNVVKIRCFSMNLFHSQHFFTHVKWGLISLKIDHCFIHFHLTSKWGLCQNQVSKSNNFYPIIGLMT